MKRGVFSAAIMLVASSAMAQHAHTSASASETGQAQFAAIAEVVTLLRDDPDTNWRQVDIKALRDHLVDMDNVTTRASVERTVEGQNVTFIVTGDEAVAASIRRMVLAHSPMLQGTSDWTVTAEEVEGGACLTLSEAKSVKLMVQI